MNAGSSSRRARYIQRLRNVRYHARHHGYTWLSRRSNVDGRSHGASASRSARVRTEYGAGLRRAGTW